MISNVFFDLDGTLIDTLPTFVKIINELLVDHQQQPVPADVIRRNASKGVAAMLKGCFEITEADQQLEQIKLKFMDSYQAQVSNGSQLFQDMELVLSLIEDSGCQWGVVTNKLTRFTIPLLEELQLKDRCIGIVCGDSVARSKPDPMPLHEACRQANTTAKQCIFIGDTAIDIEAGTRAGMQTIAVTYGYFDNLSEDPKTWGASHIVHSPQQLLELLPNYLHLQKRCT